MILGHSVQRSPGTKKITYYLVNFCHLAALLKESVILT